MIKKTFEIKGNKDSKLCNINIQMNNEDYDRILSVVDRSDCNQITKVGVKIGKIAIKIPQMRAFLPELVVDYKLTRLLENANKKFEELSNEFGVEQLIIEELKKGR